MKEDKRTHNAYTEFKKAKEGGINITQMFGEYQYIFSSDKVEISCMELKNYFKNGNDFWEIYCLKGNLFEDTERFDTFNEAKKRCRELLEPSQNKGGKK